MNYPWIAGFLMGLIIGYIFWPGGVFLGSWRRRLRPRRRRAAPGGIPNPNFKVTLDKPPSGIIDLTQDHTFEITFEWKAPPRSDDINTDDFVIPEFLEEKEER